MFKKSNNILIGLLIVNIALNLTAASHRSSSTYPNIKITKTDVAPESNASFKAIGLTGVFTKIVLSGIDKNRRKDNVPKLSPHWGGVVDMVLEGALIAAVARDLYQRPNIAKSDTIALARGGFLGVRAFVSPVAYTVAGTAVGLSAGILSGAVIGGSAEALGLIGDPYNIVSVCGIVGVFTGGVVGGIRGVRTGTNLVGSALLQNAYDLHLLTKPEELE